MGGEWAIDTLDRLSAILRFVLYQPYSFLFPSALWPYFFLIMRDVSRIIFLLWRL